MSKRKRVDKKKDDCTFSSMYESDNDDDDNDPCMMYHPEMIDRLSLYELKRLKIIVDRALEYKNAYTVINGKSNIVGVDDYYIAIRRNVLMIDQWQEAQEAFFRSLTFLDRDVGNGVISVYRDVEEIKVIMDVGDAQDHDAKTYVVSFDDIEFTMDQLNVVVIERFKALDAGKKKNFLTFEDVCELLGLRKRVSL